MEELFKLNRALKQAYRKANKDILLKVENLSICRDERQIVSNVNFELNKGEILHIKGANASGKTTILKSLLGLLPAKGEIYYKNSSHYNSLWERAIFIGHSSGLRPELSLLETLIFFLDKAKIQGCKNLNLEKVSRSEQVDFLLEKLDLLEVKNSLVTKLSAGQEKRLSLARLLIFNKPIWILDEAFSNLDIKAMSFLRKTLQEHTEYGGAAIITSHTKLAKISYLRQIDLDLIEAKN